MNNPIPLCSPDSPEWAFRATEIINRFAIMRDALIWWIECSEGFEPSGWGFWLADGTTGELIETCKAAWADVERTLEETK